MIVESYMSHTRSSEIREETWKDKVLKSLMDTIATGWNNKKSNVPKSILPFWNVKTELSVSDEIIFRGDRIVLPKALRSQFIGKVHRAHMGIESMLRRARDAAY